jgi:hypothetical protein
VPTVRREGPYRFFFYSADRTEPPHVHVERDTNRAKIERLVIAQEQQLLRAWHEYFTATD